MGNNEGLWENTEYSGKAEKIVGENRKQAQGFLGEHRGFEENTKDEGGHQTVGKHGGLWESREDYSKEKALWKAQDCGRAWTTMGENRIVVDK